MRKPRRRGAIPVWAVSLLVAAATGRAAVLRGMVIEAQSGKALARALVVVQPVAGGNGATQSVHTDVNGLFVFPPMAAGSYLVTASRRAFAPVQYGQKGWKSSGIPVSVQEGSETVLRIPLPRYGAITGRIVDENDVGLPEHEVVAYRNTRPPLMVGKAATDDRGVYRIFGLEPGAYLIRSATKMYEDGGYLPTFYRDTQTADSARAVEVVLDQDVPDITVRPAPGRLYTVAGTVRYPGGVRPTVTVTLVSDMGSEAVSPDANGRYKFSPVAPGRYEIYAQAPPARTLGRTAAYQALEVERDQTEINLTMRPEPEVQFVFEDTAGAPVDPASIQLLARQKQLSGESSPQFLQLAGNRKTFAPGRWEFSLAPSYAFYVVRFSGPSGETRAGERADGWNETVLNQADAQVKFVISTHPGAVHGVVSGAAGEAAGGAPVCLEAFDPERQRRLGELRTVRTDVRGQYRFTGLAPGVYRLASSFDTPAPDAGGMTAIGAVVIRVEEGADLAQELALFAVAGSHQ